MVNSKKLENFFLFKGLSNAEIEDLLSKKEYKSIRFSRGDKIYTPDEYERKIGFILEGKCEVRHHHSDGNSIVMNQLSENEAFGVLAAFSDNEFPTEIRAVKTCEIVFFSRDDIYGFIESNGKVAKNLVSFLTGRIEFLNNKLFTISNVRVEKKLSAYIFSEYKKNGISFDFMQHNGNPVFFIQLHQLAQHR